MKHVEILEIAKRVKLPSSDIDAIIEYLEHNEWGIAFEVLCSAIENDQLPISSDEYIQIRRIGESMGMDSNLWEVFQP